MQAHVGGWQVGITALNPELAGNISRVEIVGTGGGHSEYTTIITKPDVYGWMGQTVHDYAIFMVGKVRTRFAVSPIFSFRFPKNPKFRRLDASRAMGAYLIGLTAWAPHRMITGCSFRRVLTSTLQCPIRSAPMKKVDFDPPPKMPWLCWSFRGWLRLHARCLSINKGGRRQIPPIKFQENPVSIRWDRAHGHLQAGCGYKHLAVETGFECRLRQRHCKCWCSVRA